VRTDELPGFFAELSAWATARAIPVETIRYGGHADQVLDLRRPGSEGPHPFAIVLHGGFWRAGFTRDTTAALAVALTQAGWATANIEYRRLGPGAYRELLDDVRVAANGLDATVAVGHSAGGHLALWLAANGGARAAVALGSLSDLAAAEREQLGRGAVRELFGGESYDDTDPAQLLPLGVPQVLVHGVHDDRVPIEHARAYAELARSTGDDCRLLELDAGHFDVIDPRAPCFAPIVEAMLTLVPGSRAARARHRF
jgi:dipeptidyl aminopeptidase/acylaminoacyl peptidase